MLAKRIDRLRVTDPGAAARLPAATLVCVQAYESRKAAAAQLAATGHAPEPLITRYDPNR